MPAAIMAKDARSDASAQDEKPSCALQLKLQACRPTTYVDVVTRSRYPEAAVVSLPRDDSRSGSRPAKDHGDRDHASETVRKDGQNRAKEPRRSGCVRKHVHFAEDEGYVSATGPSPKQQQSHDVAVATAADVVCADHDDRGRVLVKSGSARVPKPVHKEEQPQSKTPKTTSRKATSQPRTSKAKKRPRTDKSDSATPPTQSTGGSYRNQYGNIVFEDFF